MSTNSQVRDVIDVFRRLPSRRKRQFFGILFVMLVGGAAEFVALGAIVPFVSIMSDPVNFLSKFQGGALGDWLRDTGVENARIVLTIVFASFVVLAGCVRASIIWLTSRFSMMVGYDLSIQIYSVMLRQNYSFHLSNTTSDLLAAMQKIQMFSVSVMAPLMSSITAAITCVFVIAALLVINFTVAVSTFAIIIVLYVLVMVLAHPLQRRNSVIIAKAQSERVRLVQEGFGGIRDIVINSLQNFYSKRFGSVEHRYRRSSALNVFLGMVPKVIVETCLLLAASAALLVLSTGTDNLSTALPTVTAFAFGLQRMLPYMQLMYRGKAQITSTAASTADVLEYLEMEIPQIAKSDKLVDFEHRIDFHNVSFGYPNTQALSVQDINITIKKGEYIGVTGPSGSGKSTFVDLFLGLHRPTQGAIKVDGFALDDAHIQSWQQRIAHVSQSVFLVEGTIRENISLGLSREEINETRLREVVRIAELEEFVRSLDMGLETTVGERGARLSGGQRQRVGLARALYLDRDILVLDEATSALDNDTQDRVMINIRSMAKKTTILSVTHRLDTLQGCDAILEMSQGTIKRVDQD